MIRSKYTGVRYVDFQILTAALDRIHKVSGTGRRVSPSPKAGRRVLSRVSKAAK